MRAPFHLACHSLISSMISRDSSIHCMPNMSLTFALQALLERHESNMAEAEEERRRMVSSLEKLESEKNALETSNARTVEENRNLLDQLESLNQEVADSDSHIESLTATLESTRQELHKLAILASRSERLEAELAAMDTGKTQLRDKLTATEEENRCSMQRVRRAERTIEHLHAQVDRIEREAQEDRERHVEVVGRLERRAAVEKELQTSAGRLKGAATAVSLDKHYGGSNVVSHFVKDILQDNANLQMGVVELRALLLTSNEEVERLRARILEGELAEDNTPKGHNRRPLSSELDKKIPLETLPELHVHHHYHGSEKDKPNVIHRKPKKKRNAVTGGIFTPPSGLQTPRSPRKSHMQPRSPSSVATILSQTSVSVPPEFNANTQRWSMQSSHTGHSFALSSIPSSPRSDWRGSTVFDNISNIMDPSRPDTPQSSCPGSPPMQSKGATMDESIKSIRAFSIPTQSKWKPITATPSRAFSVSHDPMKLPENLISLNAAVEPSGNEIAHPPMSNPPLEVIDDYMQHFDSRPFRRSNSHDSLFSISGMDIHTTAPYHRPKRIFPNHIRPQNLNINPSTAALSSEHATAKPTPHRDTCSSEHRLHQLAQLNRRRSDTSNHQLADDDSGKSIKSPTTIGEMFGGWVWGKWGVAPMASTDNLKAKSAGRDRASVVARPSGINQSGPIAGFRVAKKVSSKVVPERVDKALLEETLGE